MTFTRRQLLAAAALAPVALPLRAQAWPGRPIRLVCPYAAGGSTDILTRLLGESLTHRLGQPVVVENKPGAGTRIANDLVAKAEPDGYTVLHAAAPIAIGESLYPNLPYDVHKSFESVVSTAIVPLFLVVNASAPYKTLQEFVQWGKANANGFTFGSPGAGSAPHLTAELFIRAVGAKGVVAQFQGDSPANTDLLGGRIDATLTAISVSLPHVEAGKLRILGVAMDKRTLLQPSTPTFGEAGVPGVVGYGWYGLMVPAGTPKAIVQRLNAETNAAIADPDVRRKAQLAGLQLNGGSPVDFHNFVEAESKKWAHVIKAANIKAD